MNGDELRLTIANKSNILKILPVCVVFLFTPVSIYYSGNSQVSTESKHLSVITCSSRWTLVPLPTCLEYKREIVQSSVCEVVRPCRNKGPGCRGVHISSSASAHALL